MSDETPEKDAAPKQSRRSRIFRHWRSLSWPARIAALPIYFYQLVLSPILPKTCRYQPTCSSYALEALARHGVVRGTLLTLRRVSRCHPFESLGGGSGYDPVPGADPEFDAARARDRKRSGDAEEE